MKIAVLGIGLMGHEIASRLLQKGFEVIVYNRTIEKTKGLKAKGAMVAKEAKEAIQEAECIILTLSNFLAIEEVLFSGQQSTLKDKTMIQMSTIASFESLELQKKVYKYGGEYFECPVLGSRSEAKSGSLILMVGSTKEKFDKWQGFLKNFGPNPRYVGEVGKAAALKLALNQLIASHSASFSFSLGLVEKSGIEVKLFSEILKESSLYASMYDKKLERWLKRDYTDPNFTTKHLLKDVNLIIEEAKEKNIDCSAIEGIKKIVEEAIAKNLSEKDYSAIYNAVNKIE